MHFLLIYLNSEFNLLRINYTLTTHSHILLYNILLVLRLANKIYCKFSLYFICR